MFTVVVDVRGWLAGSPAGCLGFSVLWLPMVPRSMIAGWLVVAVRVWLAGCLFLILCGRATHCAMQYDCWLVGWLLLLWGFAVYLTGCLGFSD